MKFLVILILAVIGGAALYDSDPDFRNAVDQAAAEIEAEFEQQNSPYREVAAEMEVQAFDRRDAFRTSSYDRPSATVGSSEFRGADSSNLPQRHREMRNNYNTARQNLSQYQGRDPRNTQSMTDYYESRYNWDAARNAQRRR